MREAGGCGVRRPTPVRRGGRSGCDELNPQLRRKSTIQKAAPVANSAVSRAAPCAEPRRTLPALARTRGLAMFRIRRSTSTALLLSLPMILAAVVRVHAATQKSEGPPGEGLGPYPYAPRRVAREVRADACSRCRSTRRHSGELDSCRGRRASRPASPPDRIGCAIG